MGPKRRIPAQDIADWRKVSASEVGVAVVVDHTGGWADGCLGRVVGPAGPTAPAGWFTVQLEDGSRFLARPGEAVTRP